MAGDYDYNFRERPSWELDRIIAVGDIISLLKVVSKASDVALVAMFGIDGFDKIKELRGRYL